MANKWVPWLRTGGVAVLMAVTALAGSARAQSQPADDEAPIAIRMAELPAQPRLRGPVYLLEEGARFSAELPAGRFQRVHVRVTLADGSTRRYDLTADPEKWFKHNRKGGKVLGAVTVADAADWPDGDFAAELLPGPPPTPRPAGATTTQPAPRSADAAKPRARWNGKVVRQQVRKRYKGDALREVAVWLEHLNTDRTAWGKLPRWNKLRRAIERGGDPFAGPGLALRSYRNPQLGRLQPYTVHVPKAYDPEKPMALMILLHGSGGNYMNVISDMVEGQELETQPMLLANPGAFARQEYRHMALLDVQWVIEDMKRKYNVDADRIYVQGISLGGRGSLELAALLPETFAAICPQGVYGLYAEASDPASFLDMGDYPRWQIARQDIRTYLPNLRHTPTQIIFGWRDRTTPALNALTIKHLLWRIGGDVSARGFDADHNISAPAYLWSSTRKWMLEHERQKRPRTVMCRIPSLRFGKHRWLRVEAMAEYHKPAEVLAMAPPDQPRLFLATDNVTRISFDAPFVWNEIVADSQRVPGSGAKGSITLVKDADGKWAVDAAPSTTQPARLRSATTGRAREDRSTTTRPAGVMAKRHGLSGPIWDICHGLPVVVYGTGGDDRTTAALKRLAEDAAKLDATFGPASLPVIADTELTERWRRDKDLILVGTPRTNRLIAGHEWPFDLKGIDAGRGVKLPGLDQPALTHPGELLQFIYPSPIWPGRYAMVIAPADATQTPGAMSPANTWNPYVWVDWVAVRFVRARGRDGRARWRMRNLGDGVFDGQWKPVVHDGKSVRPNYMNWERD